MLSEVRILEIGVSYAGDEEARWREARDAGHGLRDLGYFEAEETPARHAMSLRAFWGDRRIAYLVLEKAEEERVTPDIND
jgi:hypothetical protein